MEDFDRLSRTWEMLDKSKRIVHNIMHEAMLDGKLDEDEVDLINVVSKLIDGFSSLLSKVLEDNIVSDEEFEQIKDFEERIKNTVMEQAEEDGLYSIEEEMIVDELYKFLNGIYEKSEDPDEPDM